MDGFITLFTVIICVVFVIYLSYLFSKYISKGTSKINSAKHMTVLDRLAVGQDRFILIIKVLDQHYLVSVTGQNIQILKELESDQIGEAVVQSPKAIDFEHFKSVFQDIIKKRKK